MTDLIPARTEQTRARYPDQDGHVERDGVRVFWERYGDGEPAFLARHGTVVTFDPRGNGRSDRPMDAAGLERAVVVAWCDLGESLLLAAEHPERVAGLILIAPPLRVDAEAPIELTGPYSFEEVLAQAIVTELARTVDYHPVETTGATTAATLIAQLL
jgi:pimeloyl-ACP methyl ester carboxylesterase